MIGTTGTDHSLGTQGVPESPLLSHQAALGRLGEETSSRGPQEGLGRLLIIEGEGAFSGRSLAGGQHLC
jgi:hypothetical protein